MLIMINLLIFPTLIYRSIMLTIQPMTVIVVVADLLQLTLIQMQPI